MARSHSLLDRTELNDAARPILDELRGLAEKMDPEFSFYLGAMHTILIDAAAAAHALTRAGAVDDAHRLAKRGKSSSRRGPIHAIALALAERGEVDAARQTAEQLPSAKPFSAKATLVEIVDIQARFGDFDGAAQAAAAIEDPEQSSRTLIDIARLQAQAEVGNFGNARAVPQVETGYAWVEAADLFARAGELGRGTTAGSVQKLRQAIERAKAIKKNAEKSHVLSTVTHHLAWYGDTEGAQLAARSADGTVGQEKGLVWLVPAQADRGDLAAAEQLAAGLKSKEAQKKAQSYLARARGEEGAIGRSPFVDLSWEAMLEEAEKQKLPDERLERIYGYVATHRVAADGSRSLLAALLRLRQALTDGAKAVKAAGLLRDAVTTADYNNAHVHWRGQKGDVNDMKAVRFGRLCYIAGAQGMLGDLGAALETAGLIADDDFRAGALALILSGYCEHQVRLRHAGSKS